MKLFRFGDSEKEECGVTLNGASYDISNLCANYDEEFFSNYNSARFQELITRNIQELNPPPKDARIGCPIGRPSKIVCIGLNYLDHARETGATPPAEPILFMKATSSIIGPYDKVIIPRNSGKTDWEVELGVVISKRTSYVSEDKAHESIAGYVLHNDFSEREFQLERGGTWDKGKGCDTFAPIGPYLVTPDEIGDVNNLSMWLKVNGEKVQNGNTKDMIFKVPFLIHYISQFMTLLPGDMISTGTPAGVGNSMKPPRFLSAGDVVELGIEGLGESRQECVGCN